MIRLVASLAVLSLATPVAAAERTVTIGSFDRIRVQGAFEVTIAAERTPAVTIVGDAAAIDAVEVVQDGRTLTVRGRTGRWQDQPRAAGGNALTIRLGSDVLAGASVVGGGRLRAARMAGARVDLAVTGAGSIAVGDLQAQAAVATLIGGGTITLAGRSGEARLLTNGSGAIDADRLEVGDLTVRLDGPGATSARARFTAHVVDTGLGQVTVAGNPKCFVTANAGGPVSCGAGVEQRR